MRKTVSPHLFQTVLTSFSSDRHLNQNLLTTTTLLNLNKILNIQSKSEKKETLEMQIGAS